MQAWTERKATAPAFLLSQSDPCSGTCTQAGTGCDSLGHPVTESSPRPWVCVWHTKCSAEYHKASSARGGC